VRGTETADLGAVFKDGALVIAYSRRSRPELSPATRAGGRVGAAKDGGGESASAPRRGAP
jgi:hypothetical protein